MTSDWFEKKAKDTFAEILMDGTPEHCVGFIERALREAASLERRRCADIAACRYNNSPTARAIFRDINAKDDGK